MNGLEMIQMDETKETSSMEIVVDLGSEFWSMVEAYDIFEIESSEVDICRGQVRMQAVILHDKRRESEERDDRERE